MRVSLLFLSLIPFSLFSQTIPNIRPVLFTFPTNIQLNITNHHDKAVRCNGYVYAWTAMGRYHSFFYHRIISARGRDFRNFRNFNYMDRFRSTHHSIRCRFIEQ